MDSVSALCMLGGSGVGGLLIGPILHLGANVQPPQMQDKVRSHHDVHLLERESLWFNTGIKQLP